MLSRPQLLHLEQIETLVGQLAQQLVEIGTIGLLRTALALLREVEQLRASDRDTTHESEVA